MVKAVFGQALRWQRADFGLIWMFLIVSRAVQLTFSLVYIIDISFFHFFFLSFQGQLLQKKAIYTDGYQSVLNIR